MIINKNKHTITNRMVTASNNLLYQKKFIDTLPDIFTILSHAITNLSKLFFLYKRNFQILNKSTLFITLTYTFNRISTIILILHLDYIFLLFNLHLQRYKMCLIIVLG